MSDKTVVRFKANLANFRVVFAFNPNKVAAFIYHIYDTSDPKEIEELKELCEISDHPIKEWKELTAADLDPIAGLKAKIIAEYEQEQKTALAAKDLGTVAPPNPAENKGMVTTANMIKVGTASVENKK